MDLVQVRLVGGFARAGSIKPEEFAQAEVDSIVQYSEPICGHMNDDHAESTVAMVEHFIGLDQVEKATLVAMDRLGFMVQIERMDQTFKLYCSTVYHAAISYETAQICQKLQVQEGCCH